MYISLEFTFMSVWTTLSPSLRQELLSKITEYNMYKQNGLDKQEKSSSVEKLKYKEVSFKKLSM